MSGKLDGLKIAQQIANEHGGRCLSAEYKNNNTKMLWECKNKHTWFAILSNIKNYGKWCPYCAGVKLLNGLELAQMIAGNKDGRCLSEKYTRAIDKMLWECKEGHRWYATLTNIKNNGRWCPVCAIEEIRKKNTLKNGLEISKQAAKIRNGYCLSSKYISCYSKMIWKCANGHEWSATLNSIRKIWCPECGKINSANKRKIKGLEIAEQIAEKHGGKCLSNEYNGARYKMRWQCKSGHEWESTFSNVQYGFWCPECGNIEKARNQTRSYILYHWKTGAEVVCVASYEKGVVEYFNKNKIDYNWQPKTFKMPPDKNGKIKTYRPDCYLPDEDKWIEIKGYFRKDAEEKWNWFHKEHQNSELWNKQRLKEMRLI